jgi:hypothetical protein
MRDLRLLRSLTTGCVCRCSTTSAFTTRAHTQTHMRLRLGGCPQACTHTKIVRYTLLPAFRRERASSLSLAHEARQLPHGQSCSERLLQATSNPCDKYPSLSHLSSSTSRAHLGQSLHTLAHARAHRLCNWNATTPVDKEQGRGRVIPQQRIQERRKKVSPRHRHLHNATIR